MVILKKLNLMTYLLCFLVVFANLIYAQEQAEQQEVTEEFFYSEDEVEIASLKPQKIEEAPGIVSVITAQQMKDMGARDLTDVLRIVPGFQLAINPWYAQSYGVRGVTQQHNTRILVMMDGVPLNEPYWGQSCMNWGDVPLTNVKRIEIIRGFGSALYGTYAFLAVINIITYKGEDIDGVEFSLGGGSWNTQHHYVLAGKKAGDLSISGRFDYRKSDGYDNYFIQQDLVTLLDNAAPFLPSVSMAPGKIEVPLDSKQVDIQIGYKNFEFQFKAQDYKRGAPFLGMAVSEGVKEADKSYIGLMKYQHAFGEKLNLLLKGNYYYRKINLNGQVFPRGIFGALLPGVGAQGFFSDGLLMDLIINDKSLGFQSQFDYTMAANNVLTFGMEFCDLKTDEPEAFANIDPLTHMQSNTLNKFSGSAAGLMERSANRQIRAAFIQDSWQITDNINITTGLRLDNYSDFGTSANPRISMVWRLKENTNVKVLYGHAFRAPTFNELYSITPKNVGNENLGPEKVRSFEIGLNHKLTTRINASINYFYNSLTDIVLSSGKIIIEGFAPQFENSGKIRAQGIEAEVKANFEKNTYAYFNYSYAKAEDELTGEVITNVANNLFNFGVNIGMWKYLNANFNLNYVAERKRGLMRGVLQDPRDPLAAYSLSALTLRAQNFWKNTEIILSIHNLLNTQYKDPEPDGIIYYDYPGAGRQILGSIIYKF
jgi:outer membrane cobalamin receptor